MDIKEELKSAGVYPTGPVSAWPYSRNEALAQQYHNPTPVLNKHAKKVTASAANMAGGLLKTAGQAMRHGRVSEVIRNERYETCKACPAFVESSKRCSDCGCFMEAKTWIGGDPNMLCPQKKWSR
jgi:hypothetical protein